METTWELGEDPVKTNLYCLPGAVGALTPVKHEFDLLIELGIMFNRHEFSKINLLNMNC